MPNTLNWSYVWPRLSILMAALALVVLAGGGMLYWKQQQAGADVRLASAITETLETARVVVGTASAQANAAPNTPAAEARRKALAAAAEKLRSLSHVLSSAAHRAGGPAAKQGEAQPVLDARQAAAAEAVMPAKVLDIWHGPEDGKSLAAEIAVMADDATALSANETAAAPAIREAWQQLSRQYGISIRPQLAAMRDAMNAALVSANDTNRDLIGLVAGIVMVAAAVLFTILPVAMMRRARNGQPATAPALAGGGLPLAGHRRSDRVRLGFLANLDSEIRTSVSGVAAMTDLMRQTDLDDRQRGHMDVIARSGQTLLELTANAFDYARADSDVLQLEPSPFLLRETVEDLADAMAGAAAAKGLELAMRIAPDLPDAFVGDAQRVRQVLTALVGHAIETGNKGAIVIDVSGVLGANATVSLVMRVHATGAETQKAALKHVFEPFAEEAPDDNALSPATRLRLALAERLVRLMSGKLTAEIAAEGGTVLTATLSMPIDAAKRDAKEMTASLGTGRRMLIIDDNKVTREALTEMARAIGFEAAGAEDGRLGGLFANHMAGLEKPLDIILIDSDLRGESGLQVAAELQADEQVHGTALALMTAPGTAVTDADLRRNGIAAGLPKPVGPVRLAATVRAALEAPRGAEAGVAETAETAQGPETPPANDVPLKELASVVGIAAANKDAPADDGDEPRLQVLVAEDNEVNQLVFSQILEGLDLRFRIAVNGRDAVEDFKTHRPQMILMDVSMPEMNGLEATRAIREIEQSDGTHTPIIGVTAHSLRGDQEKCMEAGMDDYMSKPISPDMIGAKIAKWMERRRPANERRRRA